MNIIHRVLQASALIALFIAGSMSTYAQSPLDLHIYDTVMTVGPNGDYNFKVLVTNVSNANVELTLIRTEANYPFGDSWSSAICNGWLCYPPEVSIAEPYTMKPGDTADVKLYMKGGTQLNTTGKVKLMFSTGEGTDYPTVEFTLIVSDAAGVPAMSHVAGSALYPNPTTGRMRFEYSLPTSGDVSITVSSMTGEQLLVPVSEFQAAGSHAADLDLSTLPAGAYVVTLNSGGTRGAQIVTVTR